MKAGNPFLAAVIVALVSPALASAAEPLPLTGINIAGPEFGHQRPMPGRHGTDYFYPSPKAVEHFLAHGMNTIRLPFRWERLQHQLGGDLDSDELDLLEGIIEHSTSRGARIILDVHNYASYNRETIGSPRVPVDALADLWRRLAERYRNNPRVIFGLMNEPKGLPTETWLDATNSAIAAIREVGAKNLILVPGNGWTGAHSWMSDGYGTPNSEVMLGVVDPADNYAFEVHQYLDADFSGTKPECRNETIGVKALTAFTQWLHDNGKRGFLGEFGGGSNPTCMKALDRMLQYMSENRRVWLGWTYWAAGPWANDYFTSIQPIDGKDRPQMKVLLQHVDRSGAP